MLFDIIVAESRELATAVSFLLLPLQMICIGREERFNLR
jgi:hypothetical protein